MSEDNFALARGGDVTATLQKAVGHGNYSDEIKSVLKDSIPVLLQMLLKYGGPDLLHGFRTPCEALTTKYVYLFPTRVRLRARANTFLQLYGRELAVGRQVKPCRRQGWSSNLRQSPLLQLRSQSPCVGTFGDEFLSSMITGCRRSQPRRLLDPQLQSVITP